MMGQTQVIQMREKIQEITMIRTVIKGIKEITIITVIMPVNAKIIKYLCYKLVIL